MNELPHVQYQSEILIGPKINFSSQTRYVLNNTPYMNKIYIVPRIPGTLSSDLRRTESEAHHFLPYSVGGILRSPVPRLPHTHVWGSAS
jgi:hypothetical protein